MALEDGQGQGSKLLPLTIPLKRLYDPGAVFRLPQMAFRPSLAAVKCAVWSYLVSSRLEKALPEVQRSEILKVFGKEASKIVFWHSTARLKY